MYACIYALMCMCVYMYVCMYVCMYVSWMLTALENVFEASGNELALKAMCMHVYMH